MDYAKFKDTEKKYDLLKEQSRRGEITPDDMKAELKKMMVLDDSGNYWMIGGKTGNWYIYNGTDWKEEDPYKDMPVQEEEEPLTLLDDSAGQAGLEAAGEEEQPMEWDPQFQQDQQDQQDPAQQWNQQEEEPVLQEPAQQDFAQQEPLQQEPFADADADPFQQVQSHRQEAPLMQEAEQADVTVELERGEPISDSALDDYSLDEAKPVEQQEISFETAESTDTDEESPHLCPNCKSRIPIYSHYCAVCGANQRTLDVPDEEMPKKKKKPGEKSELVITAIKMPSLVFFLGGLGLIAGVLFGAAFGVFKPLLSGMELPLPAMLADTRGGLAGGLLFAGIGGIGGFLSFAVSGAVLCSIYNLLAYIFGGIRLQIRD